MSRGIQRERAVRDWLLDRDWFVVRAAGSLGDADLVALKAGERSRLIEVKSTARGPYHGFLPAHRKALLFAAGLAGAEAWLAWWPPRGELRWIHSSEWPGQPAIREQSAKDAIANAEHLHRRGNLSGSVREYQRAASLRSGPSMPP